MIKKIYPFTTLINIIYLALLTFLRDPFKENYSMFSSSLFGYLVVLFLCLLLSFNLYLSNKVIGNKYPYLAFGLILGGIFPYYDGSGNLLSNLHVLFAYIAFGMLIINDVLNIEKYKLYNYQKGKRLAQIFVFIFFIDCLIYLESLGVTGIQQFILLGTSLLLNYFIAYEIGKVQQCYPN